MDTTKIGTHSMATADKVGHKEHEPECINNQQVHT